MMTLSEIRVQVRTKTLNHRSLDSLIHSPILDVVWRQFSEEQRAQVRAYVSTCQLEELRLLIRKVGKFEPTVSDLRELARDLGIINWSRKSKVSLIRDINIMRSRV